jgi:hypothetical protein
LPQTSSTHIWESQQFESMYTLQGKTWPTHHMLSTLGPRMALDHPYLTWFTYSNLSCSHQQSWAGPLLLRKGAFDTIHNTLAVRSVGMYPISLPSQPMKQWGQRQPSIDGLLLGLSGPYLRYAISTFNTYSWGSTHRSLIDTGGGYSLEGAGFSHTTLRPFQPTVSPFHLSVPPGLQFNHNLLDKPKLSLRNLWPPRGLSTTRPSTINYIYA